MNESLAAQAANDVMGLTVFESGRYSETTSRQVVDIRAHVHEVALRGVCILRGLGEELPDVSVALDRGEIAPLSAQEARDIQQEIGPRSLVALRRKLVMAQNLRRSSQEAISGEDADQPGIRARAAKQRTIIDEVSGHLSRVSRPNGVPSLAAEDVLKSSSVMGIAPTAAGKTYVIGTLLRRAGIGRITVLGDDGPMPVDIIVPTRQLCRQFAGELGDDTFRMAFGDDVPISQHHSQSTDPRQRVRLNTNEMYRRSIERGSTDPVLDAAIVIWDEAHKMLGNKTFDAPSAIVGAGVSLAGFTSTPANGLGKDVRNHFEHIESGTPLGFIEAGILRPVRLSAYRTDDSERFGMERMVSALAAKEIAENRKVMVVCQRGNETAQAIAVADMINKLVGSEDAARPISSHIPDWQGHLTKFDKGQVLAVTTTSMLETGYSSKVDTVIMAGETTSLLRATQIAGRAMRHGIGEGRLVSVFSSRPVYNSRLPVTFWNVLGLDTIEQDQYVGPSLWTFSEKDIRALEVQDGLLPAHSKDTLNEPNGRPESRWSDRFPKAANRNLPPDMSYLDDLDEARLPEGPIRTVFLASEELRRSQEPPTGAKELNELADMYGTLPAFLRRRLEKQGFTCTEILLQLGRQKEVERWYDEKAIRYLEDNPPPPLATEEMMNVGQIAELIDMSRTFVGHLIERLGISPEDRVSPTTGRQSDFYSAENIWLILEAFEEIPYAADTDVPMYELAEELNVEFVYMIGRDPQVAIKPEYKRREIKDGKRGVDLFVTADEAKLMREIWSGEGFVSLEKIAQEAGVGISTVGRGLTEEERGLVVKRKYDGLLRLCVREELARQLVERLKVPPLPIHLLPRLAIADMSTLNLNSFTTWIGKREKLEPTKVKTGDRGRTQLCYSWDAVKMLHAEGSISAENSIRYEMLAGPDEQDPVKVAYTLMLQARYIKPEQLIAQNVDMDTARKALHCSEEAFPVLLAMLEVNKDRDIQYDDQGRPQAIELSFLSRALQRVEALSAPLEGWKSYAMLKEWARQNHYDWQEFKEYIQASDWTPNDRDLKRTKEGVDIWFNSPDIFTKARYHMGGQRGMPQKD